MLRSDFIREDLTRLHTDIMISSDRSCKIVDELIVGVLNNKAKMPLFSVEERVKMLKEVTKDLPIVRIIRLTEFWWILPNEWTQTW